VQLLFTLYAHTSVCVCFCHWYARSRESQSADAEAAGGASAGTGGTGVPTDTRKSISVVVLPSSDNSTFNIRTVSNLCLFTKKTFGGGHEMGLCCAHPAHAPLGCLSIISLSVLVSDAS
jgi:hypothetical protein